MTHAELAQAVAQRHSVAPRDDGRAVAEARPHPQRSAVAHMKTLCIVARIVDGDTAVGEDAIDIEEEEADPFYRHAVSVPVGARAHPVLKRRSVPSPR